MKQALTAEKKPLLVAAGGTGGHIFPAMAVADKLAALGIDVAWLGVADRMESVLVDGRYPLHTMSISALRGKGWRRKLLLPFMLLKAIWQACRVIRRLKPGCVLAMGGFVSGPAGVAAWLCRVPVVLHEQNAVLGLTNRCLASFATSCLEAYAGTFPARVRAVTVGNPVRETLLSKRTPDERYARIDRLHVLVLGGSQGAGPLNRLVLDALPKLDQVRFTFQHQTGQRDEAAVADAYTQQRIDATVSAFITDMAAAYRTAHVVIARAGALSVAEIAAVGLPAIFVPYPHAVDDHQWYNAALLTEAGAAVRYRQKTFSAAELAVLLTQYADHPEQLVSQSKQAASCAVWDATDKVVSRCLEFLC